jgi:hypothetical protein
MNKKTKLIISKIIFMKSINTNKRRIKWQILLIIFVIPFLNLSSQQVEYTNYYVNGSGHKYRMWVPPTCNYVRGVVFSIVQMMDAFALDPNIRLACMAEDLAIIWVDKVTTGEGDNWTDFSDALTQLATLSGMPEIATAPFATFGHSSASLIASRTGSGVGKNRCFAIVQFGLNYNTSNVAPEIPFISIKNMNEHSTVDGTAGTGDNYLHAQYAMVCDLTSAITRLGQTWGGGSFVWDNPRGTTRRCLISLVAQPGGTHFTWSPFLSQIVSTFIRKAAHYQIEKNGQTITRIPENQGWLTDSAFHTTPIPMASYDNYTGDKTKAFWHIDEEMATLWQNLHQQEVVKTARYLGYPTQVNSQNTPNKLWASNNVNLTGNEKITPVFNMTPTASYKVMPYWGIFKIFNGEAYASPARYRFVNNLDNDWVPIYVDSDENYKWGATTVRIKHLPQGTAGTVSVNSITSKNVNDAPFAHGLSGTGGTIDTFIVSGPVYIDGANWIINPNFSTPKAQVYARFAINQSSSLKEVNFEITNSRLNQTFTFDSISDKAKNDASFIVSATAQSGLTPKFVILSGPATVNSNTVSLSGDTGTVTIMAYVSANNTYNGNKVVRTFRVGNLVGNSSIKQESSLAIYPNPAKESVNISGLMDKSTIQIVDLNGRIVRSLITTDNNTTIAIDGLMSGIYIVKILNIYGEFNKRLIIVN